MNGLSRKRTGVSFLKKIDRRFGDSTLESLCLLTGMENLL